MSGIEIDIALSVRHSSGRSGDESGILHSGSTQRRNSGRVYSDQTRSEIQFHFIEMEHLEVLAGDGIFVTLPQEPHVVGVVQFLKSHGKTSEFLEVSAYRPRVLGSAMNQLLFPVAADLKRDARRDDRGPNCQQRYKQHQRKQDVTLLSTAPDAGSPKFTRDSHASH